MPTGAKELVAFESAAVQVSWFLVIGGLLAFGVVIAKWFADADGKIKFAGVDIPISYAWMLLGWANDTV